MITVKLIGGLGNNMFQYALGRILAEEKNCNLIVEGIDSLTRYFPNAVNITNKLELRGTTLYLGYNSKDKTIQHINLSEALSYQGPIRLEGFFQKYQLYEPYLENIKYWFSYDESMFNKPTDKDLIIHYRLGDYTTLNWNLLPEDFNEIIKNENISYDKCYIITDDPQNALAQGLKILTNATILKQDELQDLTFMKYANRMIMSHSSFSWWSAFLGKQKKVYVPLSKYREMCLWTVDPTLDNVDLIPINEKFIKKFI
jgi:hypothetical protein